MGEPNELGCKVFADVKQIDPAPKEGEDSFISMALVLFLAVSEMNSWDEIEQEAVATLGIDGEVLPQMIANLRLGGALLQSGYVQAIQSDLQDSEGQGITLNLLSNIASGRMRYCQSSGHYALTPVGIAAAEKLLEEALHAR